MGLFRLLMLFIVAGFAYRHQPIDGFFTDIVFGVFQMMNLGRLHQFEIESGGEGGIRTPGPVTVNGFQDRRIRPLCHLSD